MGFILVGSNLRSNKLYDSVILYGKEIIFIALNIFFILILLPIVLVDDPRCCGRGK